MLHEITVIESIILGFFIPFLGNFILFVHILPISASQLSTIGQSLIAFVAFIAFIVICFLTFHTQRAGARLTQKKKLHPKFLQNLFFHTSIYVIQGKNFCSAIESATQNFFWSLQKWLVFHQFDPFKGILRPWYGFKSTWRPQKVSIVMFLGLHCKKIDKIKKKIFRPKICH